MGKGIFVFLITIVIIVGMFLFVQLWFEIFPKEVVSKVTVSALLLIVVSLVVDKLMRRAGIGNDDVPYQSVDFDELRNKEDQNNIEK